MPSAVVFGGSGQLGAAVARRLLLAGWDVWAVTREGRVPPGGLAELGARPVDGAGRSRAEVIQAVGAPVDGVFDPTAYDAADGLDLLRAGGRFAALVAVSSASVYAAPDGRSLVAASQAGGDWPAGPSRRPPPSSRRARRVTPPARRPSSRRCSAPGGPFRCCGPAPSTAPTPAIPGSGGS